LCLLFFKFIKLSNINYKNLYDKKEEEKKSKMMTRKKELKSNPITINVKIIMILFLSLIHIKSKLSKC
jgi:hypothetical protein